MKWKFVYNPKVGTGFEYENAVAQKRATLAGYKFYMWNGKVRFASNGESTGIGEEDMV